MQVVTNLIQWWLKKGEVERASLDELWVGGLLFRFASMAKLRVGGWT